jgi:hypothetical protein
LNPFVSVTAARTNLPTFFSKIWGVGAIQVSATATAEAYNPSGQNAPIQLGAVKPFLVPNCLPNAASGANPNCAGNVYFINQTDGSIANGGSFIGQQIQLELPGNASAGNALPQPSSATVTYPTTFSFFPIDIPISPPKPLCPTSALTSCNLLGKGPYFDNIACSNPTQLSCGQIVGGSTTIPVDTRVTSNTNWSQLQSRVDQGAQCLIHANNADFLQGQDIFSAPASSGQRILISPGTNNPDPSLASATYISRSDSVISVPLFDGSNLCQGANNSNQACNFTAPIVGFLQLGITRDVPGSNATVEAVILNASGCNRTATGKAVTGSSISASPVRLIQAP